MANAGRGERTMVTKPEKITGSEGEGEPADDPLSWWLNWKYMLPACYQIDSQIIAAGVFLIGLLSNAFAWMLGIIAAVPLIGPLIVKVLSLGFIWLLNAVGYLVSFVAIRRGYSRDVLTYRGVTIALIIGIVIGFVLGKSL
jgi:hypothetical protein